jgi:peptidoglycan/xylan/chitin deacetylase (PgdA/CDA1 family)
LPTATETPPATLTPIPTATHTPTPAPKPEPNPTPQPILSVTLTNNVTNVMLHLPVSPTLSITTTPTIIAQSMQGSRVPILMYHYISTPPVDADVYRLDLSVSPEDFEKELSFLSSNGYRTINLYDLYGHLALSATLPAKPIILTFDDGYRDAYTFAFPLLKKYGFTGTFFVISDFINNNNPAYLTWKMVQEMSASGMDIESHTRTHPDLRNRSNDFLVWQVMGPIEAITAYTGKRPHFFCYPSGRYDDAVISVLKSADVWGAVTTQFGTVHSLDDAMTWTRVRMHGTTTVDQLQALLR